MGNFNRDRRSKGGFSRGSGDRKSFGGGKKFGGRDEGRSTFRATCSECGTSCELPFKPTGDRPVYCSNCFDKQSGGGRSRFGDDRRGRSRFDDKQMYDVVCAKCGKDCQVPFKPTNTKPVYCNDCFGKGDGDNFRGGSGAGKDSGEVLDQLKKLNSKIDMLMEALISTVAPEKIEKSKTKKEKATKEVKEEVEEVVKEKKSKTKVKAATKKVTAKKKK